MQSAIGRIQLRKLDGWVAARRANAARLIEHLATVPAIRIPTPPSHMEPAYYKLYAYIEPGALLADWSRDRVVDAMRELGVGALSGSCPEIYLEQAFVKSGLGPAERLPNARALGEGSIMFQVHPTLDAAAMDQIGEIATRVIRAALR